LTGPAESEFQRRTRGEQAVLLDHVCKTMNPLNLQRCKCIPVNTPGADWRVLLEITKQDPSREKFQVRPREVPGYLLAARSADIQA